MHQRPSIFFILGLSPLPGHWHSDPNTLTLWLPVSLSQSPGHCHHDCPVSVQVAAAAPGPPSISSVAGGPAVVQNLKRLLCWLTQARAGWPLVFLAKFGVFGHFFQQHNQSRSLSRSWSRSESPWLSLSWLNCSESESYLRQRLSVGPGAECHGCSVLQAVIVQSMRVT